MTTIAATATEPLDRFDLDYRGPEVKCSDVNGVPATWEREGAWELVVTPPSPLPAGAPFEVRVAYGGRMNEVRDPFPIGWLPTHDGAWVANATTGASAWFPCNDHPSDKATMQTTITVPKGTEAIGNGELTARRTKGGKTTFEWTASEPIATYLATITTGEFRIERGRVAGPPYYAGFDVKPIESSKNGSPISSRQIREFRRRQGGILRAFERAFGPYPFASTGGIVDDPESTRVFYALETQSRPIYHNTVPVPGAAGARDGASVVGRQCLALELARHLAQRGLRRVVELVLHGWPARTRPALDAEERARCAARPRSGANPIFPSQWLTPTAEPEPDNLFDFAAVYARGALTLQALAERIGGRPMLGVLRAWAKSRRHGNGTTADFIALAEGRSGKDLGQFFDAWLHGPRRPPDRYIPTGTG